MEVKVKGLERGLTIGIGPGPLAQATDEIENKLMASNQYKYDNHLMYTVILDLSHTVLLY